MANSNDIILEFHNVTKTFPGVQALDNVSFQVRRGEVHALMGANGAGKSTLIKILAGQYTMDSGSVTVDGQTFSNIRNAAMSQSLGISVVFQELNVLPDLSVTENIYIRNEETKVIFYKWKKMRQNTQKLIDELGLDFRATDKVKNLSIAQQQMVEIVKAISFNAKIIILDEPTSSLSSKETEMLFAMMRQLRERGVTLIYVSHRLDEIYNNCERLSLLRDGQWILTRNLSQLPREELIENMIGRKLDEEYPARENVVEEEIMRVENFSSGKFFQDISFSVHKGEVLGLAGLVGAGRTEVAKAIFGEFKKNSGTVYLEGKKLHIRNSTQALRNGIAYATEDRKVEGLMLGLNLRQNITIASLNQVVKFGLIRKKKEKQVAQEYMEALQVKATGTEQKAMDLSGGNQQKVCLAKWLMSQPKVLILDEPTRGIDVGSKAEFYRIIGNLAKSGMAVIVISSEEQELIGLCDRILVMCEGRMTGEITEVENCEKQLMFYMLNATL